MHKRNTRNLYKQNFFTAKYIISAPNKACCMMADNVRGGTARMPRCRVSGKKKQAENRPYQNKLYKLKKGPRGIKNEKKAKQKTKQTA